MSEDESQSIMDRVMTCDAMCVMMREAISVAMHQRCVAMRVMMRDAITVAMRDAIYVVTHVVKRVMIEDAISAATDMQMSVAMNARKQPSNARAVRGRRGEHAQ